MLAFLSISWTDGADDQLVASQAKHFVQEVGTVAQSLKEAAPVEVHVSTMRLIGKTRSPGTAKSTREKLGAISRQCDPYPYGVFLRQVPGGFILV